MSLPSSKRLRLHGFPLSGHSHRVELMLSLLRLDAEIIAVDIPSGAHKSPEFLALNPLGQVPVLEDGDVVIWDSTAIIVYLAKRYDPAGQWDPQEPRAAAETHRWLAIASGLLASGPAAARLEALFGAPVDRARAEAVATTLFALMQATLADRAYLTGPEPTLADVALYSYSARAPEGGIALEPYPAIQAWLARIEALPGFAPMPHAAEILGKTTKGAAS